MPYYSDDIIEEVRSRNDIVDVIGQYVHLTKKGSSYFGLCPFHNEKTGSFSVTPSKQMYYCFGCGKGGNVFTFLQEYENMTFTEAMHELADRAGIQLPETEMTAQQKARSAKRDKLLEINKEAATYFYKLLHSDHGATALKYFEDRKLSPETMQKFGLGYSDKYSNDLYKYLRSKGYTDDILKDSGLVTIDEVKGGYDKFWNRAMFPILDANSKVIAFGGRVLGEGEPKYLNSPETDIFDKSRNLYGLHLARRTRADKFILCEGYMDVIALHQAGFDNAVASLGTALTSGHANLIKRFGKDVYLSYDSDGAGRKAALRAIPILRAAGITCKVIDMNPYKDPDEFIKNLGAEEYQKRIDNAQNSFMYTVQMDEVDFDMSDPESKTAFYKKVASRIVEFPEEIERNNYIEAVASKYNVGFENLRQMVNNIGVRQGMGTKINADEVEPRAKLKSGIQKKASKEEGMKTSQRLMLTWLVEKPELYQMIKEYIAPEDFTEGIYAQVAKELFEQFQESGMANPAKIVTMFSENDEQSQVAEIFNTNVTGIEDARDWEKAIKETIVRIKENSLEQRRKNMDSNDVNALNEIIKSKKMIQELSKMNFSMTLGI
ncbi:MAG: DNA primase [Lachnospiraceae bacterium]|nr:DNA primase [Lachnospiraceae bacterium]